MNRALKLLGYGDTDRVAIFHADDVGVCHGSNTAFLDLSQRGLISCGSVMVPCPWFSETATLAREHPELDLGVHLTINSEWGTYRWRPLSTTDRASGMIDPQGFFWRMPVTIRENATLDVDAVDTEFRAQIDLALQSGIDVTHLDSHVGMAVVPELLEVYVNLALDYDVPVLLIRDHETYSREPHLGIIDPARYQNAFQTLEEGGVPMVDHFRISPIGKLEPRFAAAYEELTRALPTGLTFLALHPSAPGDTEVVFPPGWANVRKGEYGLLQDAAFRQFVEDQGIHIVGYRQLRDAARAARKTAR